MYEGIKEKIAKARLSFPGDSAATPRLHSHCQGCFTPLPFPLFSQEVRIQSHVSESKDNTRSANRWTFVWEKLSSLETVGLSGKCSRKHKYKLLYKTKVDHLCSVWPYVGCPKTDLDLNHKTSNLILILIHFFNNFCTLQNTHMYASCFLPNPGDRAIRFVWLGHQVCQWPSWCIDNLWNCVGNSNEISLKP